MFLVGLFPLIPNEVAFMRGPPALNLRGSQGRMACSTGLLTIEVSVSDCVHT